MKAPGSDDPIQDASAGPALESIPLPCVFAFDAQGGHFAANAAFAEMIGEDADWKAEWWMDSLDPEGREAVMPLLSSADTFRAPVPVLFRRRDGEPLPTLLRIGRAQGGRLLVFTPAAQSAPTSGPVVATAADSMDFLPAGVVAIASSTKGLVTAFNRTAESFLGLARGEVIDHSYSAAFRGENLSRVRKLLAQVAETRVRQKIDNLAVIGQGAVRRVLELNADYVPPASGTDGGIVMVVIDITERYRIQEEKTRISDTLLCREENYRMLTENSSDLITRHGFEGIILFASNAARGMLGMDPDKMLGHSLEEYVHPDDRSIFRNFILSLETGGEASTIVCRLVGVDGRTIWVETRATAIRGRRGGMDLTCVTRDITERKEAEDRLRKLQNHFTSAIENMDAGIVMYDRDDKLVFCNNIYRDYYPGASSIIVPGVSHGEVLDAFMSQGAADNSGMSPEDFKAKRMHDHALRKAGRRVQFIGGGKWLQVSDHPTSDGGVVTLFADITTLKRAQDELTRQRLFLSSLLDAIPDLIFYKDADGVYTTCNPAFCAFAGRTREEIVGRMDRDIFPASVADIFEKQTAHPGGESRTSRSEEWMDYSDGRRVRLETLLTPLFDADGKLLGTVGVARDITARHIAENMLQAESMRLSTLIRSIEGGVMVVDQDLRVLLVNEGLLSLFRMEGAPTNLVGRDAASLLRETLPIFAEPRISAERLKGIFEGRRTVRDAILPLKDESFLEYDFIPIDIGHGEFNFLWHFRDITSRRRAEMELQQRDRLLSGLAQTVRQLLAGLEDFDTSITEAFRIVAETAAIERIFIFCNKAVDEDGKNWIAQYLYRWSRLGGATAEISEYPSIAFDPDFSRWYRELSRGVLLSGSLRDFPEDERGRLAEYGLGSILVSPMFIEGRFWGLMIFDAAPDRVWSASDRGILRMVADSIGLAIQRKNANEQLNSALAEAERLALEARAANQAKTDFLASMSHEIRTPLNGVVGYSNLLRNTQLTTRQSDLLRGIDRSTVMLLALINDILDLSKITAGQLTLDTIPFCPALAVEDAMAALGPRAAEKNLEFSWEADAGARQVYLGDERRLKQVILNLVGNSIKFTESGRITAKVSLSALPADGASGVRLDFSVTDTGIGIAEENIGKLFQPFSQAQSDISRRFGGTGLGLAICRQLVSLMGGEISVESTLGRGSTFRFFITCPHADEPVHEKREESGGSGSNAPDLALNILIADDNFINQEVLSMYIEELGYKAETVSDGEKAVAAVRDHQVDLVLMDLRMPGMDGLEATQAIRKWESESLPSGRRRARIVALTADAVKSDSERCMEMGMDGYLTKPVDPDQIDRVIRQLFT